MGVMDFIARDRQIAITFFQEHIKYAKGPLFFLLAQTGEFTTIDSDRENKQHV